MRPFSWFSNHSAYLVKTFPISLVDMKYHLAWLAQNPKGWCSWKKIERSVLLSYSLCKCQTDFWWKLSSLNIEEDVESVYSYFLKEMMNDFYAWQRRHWTVYISLCYKKKRLASQFLRHKLFANPSKRSRDSIFTPNSN